MRADLELVQNAFDGERAARAAESAASRERLRSLEAALLEATRRAGEEQGRGREHRLWLRAAVLVIAGGVLLQVLIYAPIPRISDTVETHKPIPAAATDSPLRRLARLPSGAKQPAAAAPPPQPDPPSVLSQAANQLGAALATYPQPQWPQVLQHVREVTGRGVCPFLWIDGTFAFILPEAPAGIGSLPSALVRCADAVDRSR